MTDIQFSSCSHRVCGQFSKFEPEKAEIIMSPENSVRGTWVGCPSVLHEPQNQRFLMSYRQRRPRGNTSTERGWRCAIAASSDGIHFKDIWSVEKNELSTPSMERFSLMPRIGGGYQLYISYVDPKDNRWRIDCVEAHAPDAFNVQSRVPVLTASSTGTEGVKDPYVMRLGPATYVFASYASAETLDPKLRLEAHVTADIYTTGMTKHPTGLATVLDGHDVVWHGSVLGVGTGWDRYQSRLNSFIPLSCGHWIGFYDGSASAEENYEERCGLAISDDLRNWHRLSMSEPWMVSPHDMGSLRYLDAVPVGREVWMYYEYARADGTHDLRMSRISL